MQQANEKKANAEMLKQLEDDFDVRTKAIAKDLSEGNKLTDAGKAEQAKIKKKYDDDKKIIEATIARLEIEQEKTKQNDA